MTVRRVMGTVHRGRESSETANPTPSEVVSEADRFEIHVLKVEVSRLLGIWISCGRRGWLVTTNCNEDRRQNSFSRHLLLVAV